MPLLAPSPTKFLTGVHLSQSSWRSPGLAKILQEAESLCPEDWALHACVIADCVKGNMQGHQVFQV